MRIHAGNIAARLRYLPGFEHGNTSTSGGLVDSQGSRQSGRIRARHRRRLALHGRVLRPLRIDPLQIEIKQFPIQQM